MADLAIKGHATRGEEVIEIFEMLGGVNCYNKNCSNSNLFCYLSNRKHICELPISGSYREIILFTLEEFLESYPYKIGDKVLINNNKNDVYTVASMIWDSNINMVRYVLKNINGVILDDSLWYAYEMKFAHKEENNEERKYTELRLDEDQDDKLATEATIDGNKITPPENYLIGKITQVDNGMLVEFVKKQSDEVDDEVKYPTTYEECCKVLGYKQLIIPKSMMAYNITLLGAFQKLLVCRDAYYVIVGEQMRLRKPWEPTTETVYCISRSDNVIKCSYRGGKSNVLEFPTEEMRDAFFENFKDLIEICKGLL